MSGDMILLEDGLKVIDEHLHTMVKELEDRGRFCSRRKQYLKLYTLVHDMCMQRDPFNFRPLNFEIDLYRHHGDYIESYLKETVLPALQTKLEEGGEELLAEMKRHWAKHKIMNREMKRIFIYLEKYYIPIKGPKLEDIGRNLFRTEIYDHVGEGVTSAVLTWIDRERTGIDAVDGSLIESMVDLFQQLGVYESDFEKPLLDATESYFRHDIEGWTNDQILASNDFMRGAVAKEEARDYLGGETQSKNLKIAETAATTVAVSCAMLVKTGHFVHGPVTQIFSFLYNDGDESCNDDGRDESSDDEGSE